MGASRPLSPCGQLFLVQFVIFPSCGQPFHIHLVNILPSVQPFLGSFYKIPTLCLQPFHVHLVKCLPCGKPCHVLFKKMLTLRAAFPYSFCKISALRAAFIYQCKIFAAFHHTFCKIFGLRAAFTCPYFKLFALRVHSSSASSNFFGNCVTLRKKRRIPRKDLFLLLIGCCKNLS